MRQNGVYTTSIEPYTSTDQSSATTITVVSTSKVWIYVNAATTLSGQINCTSTSSGVTFTEHLNANASLTAGWNILNEAVTASGAVNSGQATLNGNFTATTDGSIPWKTLNLSAASLHTASVGKSNFVQSAAAAFARIANR